ncbi:DUF917 domain-containing protein [Brevibacillus sp. B_LB10_24]|uniref:DUF917 domain-containing protein n=1 Tax=Brevibacillus sp. B_LB10_24 TaxID=3380645 RepID=UPI0038B87409
MARRLLTQEDANAAVIGGAVLGGGGGGWIDQGETIGKLAVEMGTPSLITPDELNDDDLLVTVALVGAPAAKDQYVKPVHYVQAIEQLQTYLGKEIAGIITNENGAGTTVNGWIQSAILGIPVVDAPCNGRAHPTGVMGSVGLDRLPGYTSVQTAVGGYQERFVEMVISGSLSTCASMVRKVSVEAGGLVAVARNPFTVGYAKKHCAVGAIEQAINLGKRMLEKQQQGGRAVIEAVVDYLGGQIVTEGTVETVELKTEGGFDVGFVKLGSYEMTFWNEYMTLEHNGQRLGTFPDLIMTLDLATGRPIITAEISQGQDVAVISVPKEKLSLGAGMRDQALFKPVEEIVNKEIISYVF